MNIKTIALVIAGIVLATGAYSGNAAGDRGTSAPERTGGRLVDEDMAVAMVWDVPELAELRADYPDARMVLMVTGTPEGEDGHWCIKAVTDQGTHYSNVGIYYVDAATGEITVVEPVTGEEVPIDD